MLVDARDLPPDTTLEAEVCIIGAGPAGLTLARELIDSGRKVLLLEAGAVEPDVADQSLAQGETTGDPFCALDAARARRFGGTATLWDTRWDPHSLGFRGAPLDPLDLVERDWVPDSGWPFDRAHLEPYYRRAHDVAGIGQYQYDPGHWASREAPQLRFGSGLLETSMWMFGAQRTMVDERRIELERAERVKVVLHANVVSLDTTDTGTTVSTVRAVCLPGKPINARARVVVLAAGGIENARLMLLSNRVRPGGIGNEHGLVGRYFMEHQMVRAGIITPRDRSVFNRLALYDERHVQGTAVMGKLQVTEAAMRRHRLLNSAASVLPLHALSHRFNWEALDAFMELTGSLRRGRLPERPLSRVVTIAQAPDFVAARLLKRLTGNRLFRYWEGGPDLVTPGWSAFPDMPNRFGKLDVILHAEQAPHPDNRVTLSERRDALGSPMAHLHWEWRALDVDSVRRFQLLLQREITESGFGTFELSDCEGRPQLLHPGLHHHMGTTRMHRDPARGVVDEHTRVHGMENLYVTGCSVFPTGGYINPTLTTLALSLRLADRIREVT
ncbi:MAG TPA: GMC oxidoreductase [Gemmatimonadales bacterium]|nr:GMC oxidoreductase [Gemmatimonadales bacterium]